MKGYQYANLSQISHRFRVIVFQSNRDRIAYVYSTNDISLIHSQSIIPHVEQKKLKIDTVPIFLRRLAIHLRASSRGIL